MNLSNIENEFEFKNYKDLDFDYWQTYALNQNVINYNDRFVEYFRNKINWYNLLKYCKLSENILQKYFDSLQSFDKVLVFQYQKVSLEFIERHIDQVSWEMICMFQTLSQEFIEKYKDKIIWNDISFSQKLSLDFLIKYKDKIDLEDLDYNDNISLKVKNEFRKYLLK